MNLYGYDGVSSERVVAIVDGRKKVLCWGDRITKAEIAPFVAKYGDVRIEPVEDRAEEARTYPTFAGTA